MCYIHFLALCDEFQWERQDLLRMKEIESSDMLLKEFTEEEHVEKMAKLLGRRVVGLDGMAAVKIKIGRGAGSKGKNLYSKYKRLTILRIL